MSPVEIVPHIIAAPSHRAAMDWSLVLLSQGIDHTIDAQEGQWRLVLSVADAERAAEMIRAYEDENATRWQREVKWTGLLFDWRSTFWWAVAALLFVLCETRPGLREAGAFNSPAFLRGEWWRAVSAVTLHADAAHLALNAATGLLLLGITMGSFGPGRGLLLSLLCGVGANVVEAFMRPAYIGVGASGMVMGSLGLLAARSMFEVETSAREWLGRGVLAACLLFMLLGIDVKSDVLAHLLGFGHGLMFGLAVSMTDRNWRRTGTVEWICGALAAALVACAWLLALKPR